MAFETLQRIAPKTPKVSPPATLGYRRSGSKNGTPYVELRLEATLAATVGIARKTCVDVQVGTGNDSGRIRVAADVRGGFVVSQMRTRLCINLGAFPGLGSARRPATTCQVRKQGGAALIIELPPWARDLAAKQAPAEMDLKPGSGGGARSAPSGTQSAPPRSTPAPAAPAPPAGTAITGIEVDRTPGAERIVGGGWGSVDVSPRGAHLVELLLRANGAPVDESFIAAKLWAPNKPPPSARMMIDVICRDLKSLTALGLEVRKLKGIGLQLVVTS